MKAITAILEDSAKYIAALIVIGGAAFILSGVGFQVYDVVTSSVKRHHNQQPPPAMKYVP